MAKKSIVMKHNLYKGLLSYKGIIQVSNSPIKAGTQVDVSSLFEVLNVNQDNNITKLELHLAVREGEQAVLKMAEQTIPPSHTVTLPWEKIDTVKITGANKAGVDQLWIRVRDNIRWSQWRSIKLETVDGTPITASQFKGGVYTCKSNSNGDIIQARIGVNDGPKIWLNNVLITNDNQVCFNPVINDRGDYAYQVLNYNRTSELFVNGSKIETPHQFNKIQGMNENYLYFITTEHTWSASDPFCYVGYDLVNGRYEYKSINPPRIPFGFLNDDILTIIEYNPTDDLYSISGVSSNFSKQLYTFETKKTVVSVPDVFGDKILIIDGADNLKAMFCSLVVMFGDQYGEPFSWGNEDNGFLSWNQAYRIAGLNQIHALTKDQRIEKIIERTVLNIMQNSDPEGVYSSTRYSYDLKTPISSNINNSLIYKAMLSSRGKLTNLDEAKLTSKAEKAFSYFEKQFYNNFYHFPYAEPYRFDGIVQPWNYQAAMGMLAIELYHATGNQKYYDRVESIFDSFIKELDLVDGVNLWHYWPREFYQGWELASGKSTITPVYSSSNDTRYEDYSHARITANFVLDAGKFLDQKIPIDLEAIGNNLEVSYNSFSRFISGKEGGYPTSYKYLPCLVEADNIAKYFTRVHPSHGLYNFKPTHLWAYAYAAQRLGNNNSEPLKIEIYSSKSSGFVFKDSLLLSTYSALLDFFFNTQKAVEFQKKVASSNHT